MDAFCTCSDLVRDTAERMRSVRKTSNGISAGASITRYGRYSTVPCRSVSSGWPGIHFVRLVVGHNAELGYCETTVRHLTLLLQSDRSRSVRPAPMQPWSAPQHHALILDAFHWPRGPPEPLRIDFLLKLHACPEECRVLLASLVDSFVACLLPRYGPRAATGLLDYPCRHLPLVSSTGRLQMGFRLLSVCTIAGLCC